MQSVRKPRSREEEKTMGTNGKGSLFVLCAGGTGRRLWIASGIRKGGEDDCGKETGGVFLELPGARSKGVLKRHDTEHGAFIRLVLKVQKAGGRSEGGEFRNTIEMSR